MTSLPGEPPAASAVSGPQRVAGRAAEVAEHIARFARPVARSLGRAVLFAVAAAVACAAAVMALARVDSAAGWVGLVVLALVLASPAVVLWLARSAAQALVELPDSVRRLPDDVAAQLAQAREHSGRLRAARHAGILRSARELPQRGSEGPAGGQAGPARGWSRLGELWSLRRLLRGAGDVVGFLGPARLLVMPGFLLLAVAALVAVAVEATGAALLWLLVALA